MVINRGHKHLPKIIGPDCPFCGAATEPEQFEEIRPAAPEYPGDDDSCYRYIDSTRWRWSCSCGFSSPWGKSERGLPGSNKCSALSIAAMKMDEVAPW